MTNHACLKLNHRETDFVLGVNSPIQLRSVLPSGNWLPYIEFFERQMISNGDTNGCVCFTAQESFDAQIEYMIQTGAISKSTVDWFASLGYMDLATDGLPHFHTSPRFIQILTGNGFSGNATQDAWDVLRKYGALPWRDLPTSSNLTMENYLTGLTQDMKNKAIQFLAGIGGKNSIQYHWICNGSGNPTARINALKTAPLGDGINTGNNWNQTQPTPPADGSNPGHCVMEYLEIPGEADIYDHYLPNPKKLIGYPIWYSLQAVVTVTPPPPAPTLPPNPTTAQTLTWFDHVVSWLRNIIESITPQGRAKLGGMLRSSHWESFKKEFAKTHLPVCSVCSGTKKLNAHHLKPFHVFPELELDPENIVWLCNEKECHIRVGHLGNFQSINPNGIEDIKTWRDKIRNRPMTSDQIKADMN